jgi:hypothetical protein
MRHRLPILVVCLLTAAAGALVAAEPAAAGLVTSCTGTAADVTVPGDLFVPASGSCELTNVIVNGNTTVRAGANLVLNGATLGGTLVVQPDGFASLKGSTVTGNTRLNTAFALFADTSTLGNVTATDAGFVYALGTALNTVSSTNGETYLQSSRLARNLTATGDRVTDVYDSVIRGTVSITAPILGSVICLSEVDGDTVIGTAGVSGTSSDPLVQVGAAAPLTGCGFNVFAANLALTDNTAPSYVSDNVIRGSLTCTGNDPAPVGSSARIRGGTNGQCAAPAPAPAGIAATSTVQSRAAGIVARAKARTSTGTVAATRAGRAAIGVRR